MRFTTPFEALEMINKEKSERTGRLDLARIQLNAIPAEIEDMVWLKELWLHSTQIRKIEGLEKLTALQNLFLGSNQIRKIEGLEKLTALQKLTLQFNEIQKIEGLDNLTALQSIWLHSNHIQKIECLESLNSLRTLRLDDNQILKIEGLESLTALQRLALGDNQIQKISGLESLKSLEVLLLEDNRINKLEGLDGLKSLQELWIGSNQIRRIEGLQELKELRLFEIASNLIEKIEGLEELKLLKSLRLNSNKIQKIEGLDGCRYLQTLELGANNIQRIEGLSELKSLNLLGLSSNQISRLRPAIFIFQELPDMVFTYKDNPFTDIDATIVAQGDDAVLSYFGVASLGIIPHDQIKLIFLGNSSSGKTSLSKFLVNRKYDGKEITTHGIRQQQWQLTSTDEHTHPLQVNVWDFGGQEYYHATHRLFLSSGAVYAVVSNREVEVSGTQRTTTHEKDGEQVIAVEASLRHHEYPYWLKTIQYHKRKTAVSPADGKQPPTPVFLLETKGAEFPEDEPKLKLANADTKSFSDLDLHGFRKLNTEEAWRYFLKHDSGEAESATEREEAYHNENKAWEREVKKILLAEVAGKTIPKKFPLIREWIAFRARWGENWEVPPQLQHMMKEAGVQPVKEYDFIPPWVSRKQFEALVLEMLTPEDLAVVEDKIEKYCLALDPYLEHSCGQIMSFPDMPIEGILDEAHDGSRGFVCIDPQWLHSRIYDVLSKEEVLKTAGHFTLAHVDKQVEGDEITARQMVAVMKSFRIIFEVRKDEYIAPQYLPDECPDEKRLDILRYQKFKPALSLLFPGYMPPSIITEYIAAKGEYALENIYWNKGLMYMHPVSETDAINTYLLGKPEDCELQIWLPEKEVEAAKRAAVRDFVQTVVRDIADNGSILLRLLDDESGGASYRDLCEAKREKLAGVRIAGERNVRANPYFPFLPDFEEPAVNIFISYSHAKDDLMAAHPIEKFIECFERFCRIKGVKINIVSDLNIQVGTRWRGFLNDEVQKCDLFIGLVNQGFVTSDFILKNELGEVLNQRSKGRGVDVFLLRFGAFTDATEPRIKEDQLYKPEGHSFDKRNGKQFCYLDIADDVRQREAYMELLMKKLTPRIKKLWTEKTGLNP